MMYTILLPSQARVVEKTGNTGTFEIDGLYPGYGITIGNILRRILLSSLPGSAVTHVRIDGVEHEFSTIPNVQEDILNMLLNIKKLRFIMHTDEPQTISLHVKGAKKVTGGDLEMTGLVQIASPDEHIATLTGKNAELRMELIVEKGVGYVPREEVRRSKVEVGMMTVDAFFSPVRNVKYEVENMRVGERTDYNRLRLVIETDGTMTPEEALESAIAIVVDQFTALSLGIVREGEAPPSKIAHDIEQSLHTSAMVKELVEEQRPRVEEDMDVSKVKVEDLRLPSRTINALHDHGIKTVGGLLRRDVDTLSEIPGIGDKAIQEIRRALGNLGLTLK